MSQPNTVTLTDTFSEGHVYERQEENVNRTTYISGDEHELDSRNQFQLYRTYAKRNGNSRGASKSAIKLTVDISVPNASGDGNIVLPAICECSFSLPLGITDQTRQDILGRMAQLLADDMAEDLTRVLSI